MTSFWVSRSVPLSDLANRLEQNDQDRRLNSETLAEVIANLSHTPFKRTLPASRIIALVTESEEMGAEVREKGGIPSIVNLLSYKDVEEEGDYKGEHVRVNGAIAMSNLARYASNLNAIVQATGISQLVSLYQSDQRKSKGPAAEYALSALRSMASMNTKCKQTIVKAGLDKSLLKKGDDKTIRLPPSSHMKSPGFRIGKKKKRRDTKEYNKEYRDSVVISDVTYVDSDTLEGHNATDSKGRPKQWRHSMPGPNKLKWTTKPANNNRQRTQRSVSVNDEQGHKLIRKGSHGTLRNIEISEELQQTFNREKRKELKKDHSLPERQFLLEREKNMREHPKNKTQHRDKTLKKTRSAPTTEGRSSSEEEEEMGGDGIDEIVKITASSNDIKKKGLSLLEASNSSVTTLSAPGGREHTPKKRAPITRSRASKSPPQKSPKQTSTNSTSNTKSNDKKKQKGHYTVREKDSKNGKNITKLKDSVVHRKDKKLRDKDRLSLILPTPNNKRLSLDSSDKPKNKKMTKQKSKNRRQLFVHVKCIWESDKRYIKVPNDISVDKLFQALKDEYKKTPATIKFMDSDSDFITITKASDLELCFQQETVVIFIDKNPNSDSNLSPSSFQQPPPETKSPPRRAQSWSQWENYPWRIPHQALDLTAAPCLGRGYFGEVRLGKWRGGYVACKVIYRTSFRDSTDEEMFIREVNMMSKLRHPQVILFMGACLDTDDKIIVTEYMARGSLYDLLRDDTLITPRILYNIARDIVLGMSYLHGENILHRDLNCKNILISASLSAKVADFGLSRTKAHQDSTISATMGAVAWMAPEVIADASQFTTKADVYSAGMIFWEMNSRKNPVPPGMTPLQMAKKIESEDYRPPIPSDILPEWKVLIETCWVRNPNLRPSFPELLDKLSVLDELTKSADDTPNHVSPKSNPTQVTNTPKTLTRRAHIRRTSAPAQSSNTPSESEESDSIVGSSTSELSSDSIQEDVENDDGGDDVEDYIEEESD